MFKAVSFLYLTITVGMCQNSSLGANGPCASARIEVSNLANVPEATLARAQAETSRIFHQAGIGIDWQIYQVSESAPGCPVRLIVSILRHASTFASGMALGYSGGMVHATVFWDRIDELAQTHGSTDVILGHAMAHEI